MPSPPWRPRGGLPARPFTDRWSGLRGGVTFDGGTPGDALVIVFPADSDTWGSSGLMPRRLASARVSSGREYSFNLPPGDYYVAAISDEYAGDWQDAEFLARVSRGAARVRIGEGQRQVQDVRLQEVR